MDCEKIRELLWDFDELADTEKSEILSHTLSCPDCKKVFEIIKKVQSAEITPEISVADKVIERISNKKARTVPLKALRYATAACLALVFCAFLLLHTFDKKGVAPENDSALAPEMKNEIAFDTTDGGVFDVLQSEECSENESAVGGTVTQSKTEKFESVVEDTTVFNDVTTDADSVIIFEADEQMKLNYYKEALDISSHTVDLVVSGSDIGKALEVLKNFGAIQTENHIEIAGDLSVEVKKALLENGFSLLYQTSSETPRKTLVFFEDYLD